MKKTVKSTKKIFSNLDYPLLLLMIIYSAFGMIMIFSASSASSVLRYNVTTNYFVFRQLIFVVLSFLLGIAIIFFPTKYYRLGSRIMMFLMTVALASLFIVGVIAGGAKSWFDMGFFNMQPAEFLKTIMIVYLAVYYNRLSNRKNINLFNMLWPMIIVGIDVLLIIKQPDFGSAFIIFLIAAGIFISLPMAKNCKKQAYLIGVGGLAILALGLLIFDKNIFQSYQIKRIFNFTEPCQRYTEDTGYQVCNGYIAIHNGGLFGVGLGNSTQKYLYLPEAHTDFIFPIICEELGAIVGIIIVIGYFIILFIVLKIAKEAYNIRNSILAYGVFIYLLAHILINLLGVLGLIPLTGVPLPFLSYGGSYNFNLIICLFIVERVNIENKLDKKRKKIENL